MRLPLWVIRWMHRRRMSRSRLRGTWLHSRLGDRLLDRALWRPTRESLARAWLIGFPITTIPFLPAQTLFACAGAILIRGNILLSLALQFLSTPLTAPVHLPACYMVGEIVRGKAPAAVWQNLFEMAPSVFTGDALISLYLGSVVGGVSIGIIGYVLLKFVGK